MTLNELRDKVFANAQKHGFHENNNFGESLMLVVSELSEALEADRQDKWFLKNHSCAGWKAIFDKACVAEPKDTGTIIDAYISYIKGSVEEEIVDAMIRLFDIAGVWNIDLDFHVKAKMAYNETRPYKHGKKY